jgi:hypothetical protein
MNEKEKANELVEKYLNTIIHFPYIDTEDGNCIGTGYMTHNSAVRCAINSVDEIVEYLTTSTDVMTSLAAVKYWNDVKLELQSL